MCCSLRWAVSRLIRPAWRREGTVEDNSTEWGFYFENIAPWSLTARDAHLSIPTRYRPRRPTWCSIEPSPKFTVWSGGAPRKTNELEPLFPALGHVTHLMSVCISMRQCHFTLAGLHQLCVAKKSSPQSRSHSCVPLHLYNQPFLGSLQSWMCWINHRFPIVTGDFCNLKILSGWFIRCIHVVEQTREVSDSVH